MPGSHVTKVYTGEERCETCKYRGPEFAPEKCSYSLITGRCRLCPVENCAKYEEGERIKVEAPEVIEPSMDDGDREFYDYTVAQYRRRGPERQPRFKYR